MKQKNPKTGYIIASAVLLALSFAALSLAAKIHLMMELDKKMLSANNGSIYLSIQQDSNPLDTPNTAKTMEAFKNAYAALRELPYPYYEMYLQPLDCRQTERPMFDRYTGEYVSPCTWADSMQVSENVQTDFALRLRDGTFFEEDAFDIRKDVIPVLLGAAYAPHFQIGDRFSAQYLFRPFTFEVVGILEEGSTIRFSAETIPLDRYVLMPSFHEMKMPETEDEYATWKIHYANKISGLIKTDDAGFSDAHQSVRSILDHSIIGAYTLSSSSAEKNLQMRGFRLKSVQSICITACVALFFASAYLSLRWLKACAACPQSSKKALFGRWMVLGGVALLSVAVAFFALILLLPLLGLSGPNIMSAAAEVSTYFAINGFFVWRISRTFATPPKTETSL